jgi:hypothetical protein
VSENNVPAIRRPSRIGGTVVKRELAELGAIATPNPEIAALTIIPAV